MIQMPTIELATSIAAPVELVFDLSRSIDLHMDSATGTGERAIAGVTSGLIGWGEEVTWRARHFGVWQRLSVRITVFERPTHFADVMVRGAFRRMEHHHYFESEPSGDGTVMRDVFTYESPLGFLGRVADWMFLERYMRAFLMERNRVIKEAAEAEPEVWRRYLGEGRVDVGG
jgi:ligand-binding SRPBCC domain-containing protein